MSSRGSLYGLPGIEWELCGHIEGGAGGDSLRVRDAGELCLLVFSPVVGDGQEATWLIGDTGLEGNATPGHNRFARGLSRERTEHAGFCQC